MCGEIRHVGSAGSTVETVQPRNSLAVLLRQFAHLLTNILVRFRRHEFMALQLPSVC